MISSIKNISAGLLFFGIFGCGGKHQNVPHYTVSKIFKTDSVTTLNVHINNRITAAQLLLIAGKLKADSAQIKNLEIHYLLPGNTDISMGEHSYYASARILNSGGVKPTDTLKDDNGNVFRIKIFGLDHEQVKRLLALQPNEIVLKNVLGRFVDDYNHTVIIPFTDNKDDLKIIELDSAGKVVSATMPLKVRDGMTEKWQVTQQGDYMTLKDSVLKQFPANGFGVPFNSIKSGI